MTWRDWPLLRLGFDGRPQRATRCARRTEGTVDANWQPTPPTPAAADGKRGPESVKPIARSGLTEALLARDRDAPTCAPATAGPEAAATVAARDAGRVNGAGVPGARLGASRRQRQRRPRARPGVSAGRAKARPVQCRHTEVRPPSTVARPAAAGARLYRRQRNWSAPGIPAPHLRRLRRQTNGVRVDVGLLKAYGTTPGVGVALAPRGGTWPGSYMSRQARPTFSRRSKQ